MGRILILEDEEDQVVLYRLTLEHDGHEIVAAGPSAVAPEGKDPDLVILDERLGWESGSSRIPELRKRHPGARILIVTADPVVWEEAQQRGADAGLQKPVSLNTLVKRVRTLLAAPARRART